MGSIMLDVTQLFSLKTKSFIHFKKVTLIRKYNKISNKKKIISLLKLRTWSQMHINYSGIRLCYVMSDNLETKLFIIV